MPILLQNQGISELENILKSEALVDDVLQPGYYEKYFSVFSTLNDIKEKYIGFSQGKIQECERIFSKILQDINILVKKSNILSKVPSLLVKSIITKSEYEIERNLNSFTSTNPNNIDFDIEMKQI
ncbi:hypothetical protein CWI37_1337p0020 [Hamiltosporidium tvaerminnensis]|uniref:Uncharacterized protein n=1 Tax=Hamiltosporidium tvaerminnensis TaxID=1176355 RepID=A0A4Q9KX26_9MICR|nr:hypothetical protein CWI37_1337p0020 [Hamiltosporidium tvaerminnensis]